VHVKQDNGQWYLQQVEKRHNVFSRTDSRGHHLSLAANLDRLIIVCAARPGPGRNTLEKYLIAAANLGIPALLAANKSDLPESERRALGGRLELLRSAGFEYIECSTKTDHGLDQLRGKIAQCSVMMVGQSGVGKSSLANRLLPGEALPTAGLTPGSGKGAHTTTTVCRHSVPGMADTYLIDSPGVWEFSLGSLSAQQVGLGFPDFTPFLDACRFRDCTHLVEPSCAIRDAVSSGLLAQERYASYQSIMAELARRA